MVSPRATLLTLGCGLLLRGRLRAASFLCFCSPFIALSRLCGAGGERVRPLHEDREEHNHASRCGPDGEREREGDRDAAAEAAPGEDADDAGREVFAQGGDEACEGDGDETG